MINVRMMKYLNDKIVHIPIIQKTIFIKIM